MIKHKGAIITVLLIHVFPENSLAQRWVQHHLADWRG